MLRDALAGTAPSRPHPAPGGGRRRQVVRAETACHRGGRPPATASAPPSSPSPTSRSIRSRSASVAALVRTTSAFSSARTGGTTSRRSPCHTPPSSPRRRHPAVGQGGHLHQPQARRDRRAEPAGQHLAQGRTARAAVRRAVRRRGVAGRAPPLRQGRPVPRPIWVGVGDVGQLPPLEIGTNPWRGDPGYNP